MYSCVNSTVEKLPLLLTRYEAWELGGGGSLEGNLDENQ